MKYVVLDTCVLVNCTLVNAADADPELLVAIVDKIREQGARLLVPDVVRLEYERKVPEELQLIRRQTKKFRDGISTDVLPGPDVSQLHAVLDQLDAQRSTAAARAQEYVSETVADSTICVLVPLTGDSVAQAIGYVLAGRKPSKGSSKGLIDPDSLIVASLAEFVHTHELSAEDVLLVCSDNHKDFAQWDQDSDAHVLAQSIGEAIPCEVRFYKSPRQLLEQELQTVVEEGEPLTEALNQYDQMAHTMASLSDFQRSLAAVRSSLALDPAVLDAFRRATAIDPAVLESIRRATAIDPAILENSCRAVAIDPAVLESLCRAATIGASAMAAAAAGDSTPESEGDDSDDGNDDPDDNAGSVLVS